MDRIGGIGKLFYGFKSGAYLNTVFTMFMMNLFIFLWSLLLVVPGIIKSCQYSDGSLYYGGESPR